MKYYFPERRIFLNSVKDIKKYAKTLLYADWVSHIAVLFGFMVCILGLSFAGYASLALLNKYAHLTEVHYGLLSVFFTLFIGLPVIRLCTVYAFMPQIRLAATNRIYSICFMLSAVCALFHEATNCFSL